MRARAVLAAWAEVPPASAADPPSFFARAIDGPLHSFLETRGHLHARRGRALARSRDRIDRAPDEVAPIESIDGGFPLIPVGAGLIAMGAAWSTGGAIFAERYWWATLLAGAALGAASAGIAFALE